MISNAEVRMRSAEYGLPSGNSRCAPPLRIPQSPFRLPESPFRLGVTLIELLIAIAIIATLAVVFLGASNAAMEHARQARTKSTVSKLHSLLMERWASYQTRRVEISPSIRQQIEQSATGRERGLMLADARLLATRELMKLEMPDRWSDVTGFDIGGGIRDRNSSPPYPMLLEDRPAITKSYLRRYVRNTPSEDNEGAECLYMIIMLGTAEGEARTLFSSQDIGDTDGDGAPEFLDGWGRPIHFLRWPTGFTPNSSIMSGDPEADHDPFDMFRRDQPLPAAERPDLNRYPNQLRVLVREMRARQDTNGGAFRLLPLIFSAGPDGSTGVHVPGDKFVQGEDITRQLPDPYVAIYGNDQNSELQLLGVVGGPNGTSAAHLDNIHNHLQEAR